MLEKHCGLPHFASSSPLHFADVGQRLADDRVRFVIAKQMQKAHTLGVCLHAEASSDDVLRAFFVAVCRHDGVQEGTAEALYPAFKDWLLSSGWSLHNATLSEVSAARYSAAKR
jgi:hypothetical protein